MNHAKQALRAGNSIQKISKSVHYPKSTLHTNISKDIILEQGRQPFITIVNEERLINASIDQRNFATFN